MSTLRTNEVAMLDDIGKAGFTFDSVAQMKDSTQISVGQKVRTLGYNTPGDGGGNDYEIVAAGTGTDDGGSFISLAGSGLQAKGLFATGVNIKQFGASGDCTGVGSGTDDTSAIQAAFLYWASEEFRKIEIPEGRYRISGSISVDFNANVGNILSSTGWLTPDSDSDQTILFENGFGGDFELKIVQGGTLADFSAATPGAGGTECIVIRGIRRARFDITGWGHAGRLIRTKIADTGQPTTSDNHFHVVTGERLGAGFPYAGDIGQVMYADSEGNNTGNWGFFEWDGEANEYGPVWENLNDVNIGSIEAGRFRQGGVEFRGVQGCIFDKIYIGEGDNGPVNNDGVTFKASPIDGRECGRVSGAVMRFIRCLNGLVCEGFSFSQPGITVGYVDGNEITNSVVKLNGIRYATFSNIGCLQSGCVLEITGTNRDIKAHVNGRNFQNGDALIIEGDSQDIVISGALREGDAGFSLVSQRDVNRVSLVDLNLDDDAVDQLIDILPTGSNGLKVIRGKLLAGGTTLEFTSGRRPNLLKDIESYPTYNKGNATIPNGASSVSVNHGLARQPSVITLTGVGTEAASPFLSGEGETSFTINVPSSVTADRTVRWSASSEEV